MAAEFEMPKLGRPTSEMEKAWMPPMRQAPKSTGS